MPAFLPMVGGTLSQAFNASPPTNAPVSIQLLSALPTLAGSEMQILLVASQHCRIALTPDSGTFANKAAMAAEAVLWANTYFPIPCIYPTRSRLWICSLNDEVAGVLYAIKTSDS